LPPVRLNPDGTLDSPFASPEVFQTTFGTNFIGLKEAAVLSDGKILALGTFILSHSYSGSPPYSWRQLYRLNVDGSVDSSFVPVTQDFLDFYWPYSPRSLGLQANRGILLLSRGHVNRYTRDGNPDPTFTSIESDAAL
jgi:hypothetical protein